MGGNALNGWVAFVVEIIAWRPHTYKSCNKLVCLATERSSAKPTIILQTYDWFSDLYNQHLDVEHPKH